MEALNKLYRYVKESAGELKKITWPRKDEVLSSTRVVLILICVFSLILGVFDYLVSLFLRLVFY